MKNNAFERVMLVLIFFALIYAIVLLSRKPVEKPATYFQYIPQKSAVDTTAHGGTTGQVGGPKFKIDTLLISTSDEDDTNADCPCCPRIYAMARSSSDSTSGGTGGPHFYLYQLTSSGSASTKKEP